MPGFNELPAELKIEILKLLGLADTTRGAQVSKEWYGVFKPTIKNKLLDFLADDEDACKKINLNQLMAAVGSCLEDKNDRIKFFVALKKMEHEVIEIGINSTRREREFSELKFKHSEMQDFLVKRFGIAGLVHPFSVTFILGTHTGNERDTELVTLAALEKLLQQDSNKYTEALNLINELFKNHIIKIDNAGTDGLLEFRDNKLHLKLHPREQSKNSQASDVLSLTIDDISSQFEIDNKLGSKFRTEILNKTEELLKKLESPLQMKIKLG